MEKITIRKILLISFLLVTLGIVTAVSRGPFVSNMLKKLILPELSAAAGEEVLAQKISLNIFPLFIEAKELQVFDGGNEIMHIPQVKGYVEASGLLRRELILRRIAIREPDIRTDSAKVEEIVGNVKRYLAIERKAPIKVIVRAVALQDGKFALGHKDMSFQGSGFAVEAVFNQKEGFALIKRPMPRINFRIKELSSSIKGWPDLKGEIKGAVAVRDKAIEVKGLQIGFFGSRITVGGVFPTEGKLKGKTTSGLYGDLKMGFALLVESFRKIFGLKQRGEGEVSASGTMHLNIDDPLKSDVDLKLGGEFYIQTLMELLKVKERVEGKVDFTGTLKGPLGRIAGTARAHFQKGNLFDVDVDDLRCNIAYRDKRLYFTEGKGALYNGRADAEATLAVAGESYYSLKVAFAEIDSPAAFKLIGWDPGIPKGKVKGELSTEGERFNPSGWYSYESTGRGSDVMGRVRRAKGSFDLRDDVVTLSDSTASTDMSSLNFSGTVDLNVSGLSLNIQGKTTDLKDLTVPYMNELAGSGEFAGTLTGKFDNPVISGRLKVHSALYEEYVLGEATGDVIYRKDLLDIKELLAVVGVRAAGDTQQPGRSATVEMKGTIRFPEARELFDLKKPSYGVSVSMKNADVEKALKVIYKKRLMPQPAGSFDTVFNITGSRPLIKGSARMAKGTLEGVPVDAASLSYSYDYNTLILEDVLFKKGDSILTGKGSVTRDDRFTLAASGSRLLLKDVRLSRVPADAYISFKAEGNGTLDDPRIELEGTVHGGTFRDQEIGDGKIRASVKDKTLLLEVAQLDGRTTLNGRADLRGEVPWTARLDMKSGRYDFLVATFLKDLPEDMLVIMKGQVEMSGDRNHISAGATINQLNVALFGNSFSNDSDIRFEVKDRKVSLSTVRMRSGATSFKVSGDVDLGKTYNLVMEGSSALTPLKGLSKRIETVRGEAGFVFSVTGKWDSPKINGGVTVSNAFFGMKDIPYRLSSLNGYFYVDEDRIVMQKLSGKLGGGDVEISGIALLQGIAVKRFYVNAVLGAIGVNISKDFTANFNGNLYYTGTMDTQTLSGEIRINRALYREPVKWQIWPLGAKTRERPRGEIGAFDKTYLNVRVQGSDNILINNNVARASLSTDVIVRGTVSNPLLFGRVETKSGIVYFRNNEFRILNAAADFADPKRINPTMSIVAETSIEGYTIRMALDGQIEHFNLSLSSTPSLEQIEILSLLTGGTLAKEPKGIQGGMAGSAATSFLSGQVQDIAQERLRSLTGIDRIGVESSVSRVTGKSEQRLTVSKRLLGDRLSVTYSAGLGSVATDIIRLEYNVGNNVSLVGVRDEVGALGGSIKFRFGFK